MRAGLPFTDAANMDHAFTLPTSSTYVLECLILARALCNIPCAPTQSNADGYAVLVQSFPASCYADGGVVSRVQNLYATLLSPFLPQVPQLRLFRVLCNARHNHPIVKPHCCIHGKDDGAGRAHAGRAHIIHTAAQAKVGHEGAGTATSEPWVYEDRGSYL